jgi:hypothetical protein
MGAATLAWLPLLSFWDKTTESKMKRMKILWSVTALCVAMLLTAPLDAFAKGGGGGGKAAAGGNVTAGGGGDVGGGGSVDTNANTNTTNNKAKGKANGNANGGGNGTNGDSDAAVTSKTTVTAKNKNGRPMVKVIAIGTAEADATQGGNNAQAGGGTTLKAKATGGSNPKAKSTSDSTGVIVVNGKIRVLNGTLVYVDNKGKVIGKVVCDGGNCSGAISNGNRVKAFSFHADEDWDPQGGGLFAATKTAGSVAAWASRNSAGGRGSFFAGAFSGGGNSGAYATSSTYAFAKVQLGSGPRQTTISRSAQSRCSTNTFLAHNVMCKARVR